ncbi:MAG: trehalase-like domain-containing protein [Nitrospirales bacterium]
MIDMTEFKPDEVMNGYPPIEDHGLIEEGVKAALVRLDGAIDWLCVPRFDSFTLLCRLLDGRRGVALIIAQVGIVESRLYYELNTTAAFANRVGAGKGRVSWVVG